MVRQAWNCGKSCGLASSTLWINGIAKFHLGTWGTARMFADILSDAGRPTRDRASGFGVRLGPGFGY